MKGVNEIWNIKVDVVSKLFIFFLDKFQYLFYSKNEQIFIQK